MDFFEPEKPGRVSHDVADLAPLADRMRPKSFDGFVGQQKIVGKGAPLRKAIEEDKVPSIIFWGPPGAPDRRLNPRTVRAILRCDRWHQGDKAAHLQVQRLLPVIRAPDLCLCR